jgi:hypothetical protein
LDVTESSVPACTNFYIHLRQPSPVLDTTDTTCWQAGASIHGDIDRVQAGPWCHILVFAMQSGYHFNEYLAAGTNMFMLIITNKNHYFLIINLLQFQLEGSQSSKTQTGYSN